MATVARVLLKILATVTAMIAQHHIDTLHRLLAFFGLGKDASFEDIRKAYRRTALTSHPDRFDADPQRRREAEERMKEINAAYAWLNQHQWMLGIDWNREERRKEETSAPKSPNARATTRTAQRTTPHVAPQQENRRFKPWQIWLMFFIALQIIRGIAESGSYYGPEHIREQLQLQYKLKTEGYDGIDSTTRIELKNDTLKPDSLRFRKR